MKYKGSFDNIKLTLAQSIVPWNEHWEKYPKGADIYIGISFAGTTDVVWFDEESGILNFLGTIQDGEAILE